MMASKDEKPQKKQSLLTMQKKQRVLRKNNRLNNISEKHGAI